MRCRGLHLVAAFSALLAAGTARAQTQPDEATRLAARTLGEAGLSLYEAGDYAGALQKYERALALVQVPTLGVRAARCLVKLGRLVEASGRYRQVAAMIVDERMPAAFRSAQAEAKEQAAAEDAALAARIPVLQVALEGATATEVVFEVDGAAAPAASTGSLPLDPGTHRISARRGTDLATEEVALHEGQSTRVVLKLPVRIAPAPTAAPIGPAATPVAVDAKRIDARPGSAMRTGGMITMGVGGATHVAGGILYAAAAGKTGHLDELCPHGNCHPDATSELDAYNTLRTASSITLVGGAVIAAAGLVVFLAAPATKREPRASRSRIDVRADGVGVAF
jgi:hypothetical protein